MMRSKPSNRSSTARAFLREKIQPILDLIKEATTGQATSMVSDDPFASTPASMPAAEEDTTEEVVPLGRLLRRDMDPNRSVFSQRVERQMANTGMDEEEARQAVRDRRLARQERIEDIKENFGLGRREARRVQRYGDRNKTKNEDGTTSEPNYKRARRVIEMARKKGLKRSEVASILGSRREARRKENES